MTNSYPLLQLSGISKSFGNNKILKEIDLKIYQSDSLVLIGSSGAGKSLILKCIMGLITFDEGSITFKNDDISNYSDTQRNEFLKHFGKPVKNSPKPVDELDQLIIEIANSEKDRSVDTIRNQIKKELRKEKYKNRIYDKDGILQQWKDDKRYTFIWRHKNIDGKITEKTCSHGTLKNRISKLAKIGVIS